MMYYYVRMNLQEKVMAISLLKAQRPEVLPLLRELIN